MKGSYAFRSCCIPGQGTLPYEQYTQQSPGSGLNCSPHWVQMNRSIQPFSGMTSCDVCPQAGHVMVTSKVISFIGRSSLYRFEWPALCATPLSVREQGTSP